MYHFRLNGLRKLLLEPESVPAAEFKEILQWREELKQTGGKIATPLQDVGLSVPREERRGMAIPHSDVRNTVSPREINGKGLTFSEQMNNGVPNEIPNRAYVSAGQLPERSQLFVGKGGRNIVDRTSVATSVRTNRNIQPNHLQNMPNPSHNISSSPHERYIPLTHSAPELQTLPSRLSHIDLDALKNNVPQNDINKTLPTDRSIFNQYTNDQLQDISAFTMNDFNPGPSLSIPDISLQNSTLPNSPRQQNSTLPDSTFELSPSFLQTLEHTAPLKTSSTISQNMFPYDELDNLDLSSVSEFSPDLPGQVLGKQTQPQPQHKHKEDFLELSKPNIQVMFSYYTCI